jgi:hypothetical protein
VNRRAVGFAVAAVVGFTVGLLWWTREQEEHRRALFSKRPMRRLAALGWLSGQPTAETVVMLREYLSWESNPVLRRRARRLLTRFENALA